MVELDHNYRAERDPEFAAMLRRLRVGEWTEQDIQTLRGRVMTSDQVKVAAEKLGYEGILRGYFPRRAQVKERNEAEWQEWLRTNQGKKWRDVHAEDFVIQKGRGGETALERLVPEDDEDCGGPATVLHVGVGVPVMIRMRIDPEDGMVSGAVGRITGHLQMLQSEKFPCLKYFHVLHVVVILS